MFDDIGLDAFQLRLDECPIGLEVRVMAVRRCDDFRDLFFDRFFEQGDGLCHRFGAVVDARQDV